MLFFHSNKPKQGAAATDVTADEILEVHSDSQSIEEQAEKVGPPESKNFNSGAGAVGRITESASYQEGLPINETNDPPIDAIMADEENNKPEVELVTVSEEQPISDHTKTQVSNQHSQSVQINTCAQPLYVQGLQLS